MRNAFRILLTKVFATPLMQRMLFVMLVMALAAIIWPDKRKSEPVVDVWIEYGEATFYANYFEGRKTASGAKYYHNLPTAAHRSLPLGTNVRVTCVKTRASVVVEINDRGPFVDDRVIDLSKSAFSKIANPNQGVILVKIEIIK